MAFNYEEWAEEYRAAAKQTKKMINREMRRLRAIGHMGYVPIVESDRLVALHEVLDEQEAMIFSLKQRAKKAKMKEAEGAM